MLNYQRVHTLWCHQTWQAGKSPNCMVDLQLPARHVWWPEGNWKNDGGWTRKTSSHPPCEIRNPEWIDPLQNHLAYLQVWILICYPPLQACNEKQPHFQIHVHLQVFPLWIFMIPNKLASTTNPPSTIFLIASAVPVSYRFLRSQHTKCCHVDFVKSPPWCRGGSDGLSTPKWDD